MKPYIFSFRVLFGEQFIVSNFYTYKNKKNENVKISCSFKSSRIIVFCPSATLLSFMYVVWTLILVFNLFSKFKIKNILFYVPINH